VYEAWDVLLEGDDEGDNADETGGVGVNSKYVEKHVYDGADDDELVEAELRKRVSMIQADNIDANAIELRMQFSSGRRVVLCERHRPVAAAVIEFHMHEALFEIRRDIEHKMKP
jgi:hypothetical protein